MVKETPKPEEVKPSPRKEEVKGVEKSLNGKKATPAKEAPKPASVETKPIEKQVVEQPKQEKKEE